MGPRSHTLVIVVLGVGAACGQLPRAPEQSSVEATIAVTHVNVVDVERGQFVPDQTIFINGTRISSVTSSSAPQSPARARETVDGRGMYAIPGLWDMHAHVLGNFERRSLVLLANGVTGIRHPGNGSLDSLRAVKARLRTATQSLPRLNAAGVVIDGNPPVRAGNGTVVLTKPENARGIADSLLAAGVDVFKVYARLQREPFFALAAEARRRGVPLIGHVPNAITPEEMSDAGARSIEHVAELPLACSSRATTLRALRNSADTAISPELDAVRRAIRDTVLATHDPEKCRRIAERLRANGTFVTPTLYLMQRQAAGGRPTASDSIVSRYFPAARADLGSLAVIPELRGEDDKSRGWFARMVEIVRVLHRAGVPLLAGTDTQTPLIWLGFSLHDELQALVDVGGLTPTEALRTATLNPALYFHAADTMGTVKVNRVADIVLLQGNPLADIRHTREIAGVIVKGRYFSRTALDSSLASVAELGR